MSKFFLWNLPSDAMLLRITESGAHEALIDSEWVKTTLIMEYFAGKRHDIEPIDLSLENKKVSEEST